MSTTALTNLWNYIQGMSLSDRNKQWLADRLIESKSTSKNILSVESMEEKLEKARAEIKNGQYTKCSTKEDLQKFLEAL